MDRKLPYDLNAEAAVLSAMMLDSYSIAKAVEKLEENFFYRKAHRLIFRALVELFEENTETDIITIADRLKQNKQLEDVGGQDFINDLSEVVLSSANIDYHTRIVLDKALLRQLINASNRIIEKCYTADAPVDDIVDSAEQEIFSIAERPHQKTFVGIKNILPTTIKHIEEISSSKKGFIGVPSGFSSLDRKLGGFRPGQLIVLAARPAMGKTALALNFGFNAAVHHDKKVGIFTMEMENEELVMRMLSSASEVSMDNILKGYGMDEKKIIRISGVADVLSEKHIFIDDNGSNTILDIRAKSRRLKAELDGLDLIIIDYLQLMSSKGRKENRQQEIAEISRNLKILAKELGLPIIALSQLNRGLESRPDKRPMLSDLRESGAIERDADMVMFIYRDVVYNENSETPNSAEVIIGKNRHGAIGKIDLFFKPEFTQFKEMKEY